MTLLRPRYSRYLVLLGSAALLAGCASGPRMPMPQPQPQPQPRPEPTQPPGQVTPLPPEQPPQVSQQQQQQQQQPTRPAPPRRPEKISSPAVMALLGTADTLAKAGHMQRAAATLQRALNIEPRNPFVYQRLAAVRLVQGRLGQAQALAHKSNSLAVGNPFIHADNWVLIAEAREAAGDQVGRRKAMAKVRQYRTRSAAFK